MPGLADTLAMLARTRRPMTPGADFGAAGRGETRLAEVTGFGANPGGLRMFGYVPPGLRRGSALVVVLHGCGQTAAGYDQGAGWSALAERFGFALVLPEQVRANNAGTCFNWFQPEDATRGHGEAASVRAMVAQMVGAHGIDPRRVFITGLSAGGAFANVMLAAYPALFAGGAIVAGLPYGAARDLQSALGAMHAGVKRSDGEWGELVRAASGHAGPWPRISVWHGLADTVVAPVNATDSVRQWLDVHGLAAAKPDRGMVGPAEHLRWRDGRGRVTVESYTLPAMGHGVPISAADADAAQRCGMAAPFILESGISSSYVIAADWGLVPQAAAMPVAEAPAAPGMRPATGVHAIAGVIQKALRAAGLGG